MSTAAPPQLQIEEYLALERVARFKHEYVEGVRRPMTGGSRIHSLLGINLGLTLQVALEPRGYWVYNSELKIRTPRGNYFYPDLSVGQDDPQSEETPQDTLLNPLLVVEILSPSTEAFDRGRKFSHYCEIDSLQTYILVSQDRPRVEVFTRQPDDRWMMAAFVEGQVQISVPEFQLEMSQIYHRIHFGLAESDFEGDAR